MTITTATLQDESLRTGSPSSPSSLPSLVIVRQFDAARPQPLPGTVSLDELLDSFANDTQLQEALSEARKSFAKQVYTNEVSLSALRMQTGLSQAQLASRMGTTQSYIARIEGGTTDPGTDNIARLAEALGTDEATVFVAVRNQRKTRGSHDC